MTANYLKGLQACQQGNFEEGIYYLGMAILENPTHVEALYNRGTAFLQIHKYAEAIEDFDKAASLAPFTADIFSQRGIAWFLAGKSEKSLEDLDKALSLDPQNPYRYSSRAFVRAKIGDVFGAIEDYEMCIKLDPEDAIALNNLGLLEQQLGYKQSAAQRFAQADAIADKGKHFEKPDIKKILAEHRKEKTITIFQPEKPISSPSPSVSYWKVVREVFTRKKMFLEFLNFWKEKVKNLWKTK
ncbi:MAG: tetratricopeptide repeat protein [Cytophagales bacterium]|nr:tetratricopeptide repeat protein [Cytophagales bacterium]MDW8384189.1 tetratricopeptide repeat protein [Flammeovirgaceae bacterium]